VVVVELLVWPIAASAREVIGYGGVRRLAAYFGFMVGITVA